MCKYSYIEENIISLPSSQLKTNLGNTFLSSFLFLFLYGNEDRPLVPCHIIIFFFLNSSKIQYKENPLDFRKKRNRTNENSFIIKEPLGSSSFFWVENGNHFINLN